MDYNFTNCSSSGQGLSGITDAEENERTLFTGNKTSPANREQEVSLRRDYFGTYVLVQIE